MFTVGSILITVGISGLIFYAWGFKAGSRFEKQRYVCCIDEKSGRIERVWSK